MRIDIIPPSAIEAESVKVDEKGLSIKPLFYGSGKEDSPAAVLRITSNKGELIFNGVLNVSGLGKLSIQDRTRAVIALADRVPDKVKTSQ
jgi:hypothetical protein